MYILNVSIKVYWFSRSLIESFYLLFSCVLLYNLKGRMQVVSFFLICKVEKSKIVDSLKQKHQENILYHAEIQRLGLQYAQVDLKYLESSEIYVKKWICTSNFKILDIIPCLSHYCNMLLHWKIYFYKKYNTFTKDHLYLRSNFNVVSF